MAHFHTREIVTARCAAKLTELRSEAAPAQRQRSSNGCKAKALSPSTNLLREISEAFAACAARLLSPSFVTRLILACRSVLWMTPPASGPSRKQGAVVRDHGRSAAIRGRPGLIEVQAMPQTIHRGIKS